MDTHPAEMVLIGPTRDAQVHPLRAVDRPGLTEATWLAAMNQCHLESYRLGLDNEPGQLPGRSHGPSGKEVRANLFVGLFA